MENIIRSIEYDKLAKAMFRDTKRIFIVDVQTEEYAEYLTNAQDQELKYVTRATDFYGMIDRTYRTRVYAPDRDMFQRTATRENLLRVLGSDTTFSLLFRILQGDTPEYFRLKAMYLTPQDPSKIIVAVSKVKLQMQRPIDYEMQREESLTCASVSEALAADYICIYYVNMDTGSYKKFNEHPDYTPLNFPNHGERFFEEGIIQMSRIIHDEDREIFNTAFQMENVKRVLSQDKSFTLTYRMMLNGEWNYISIKATRMESKDNHHIVVAFSNVNAHMKRLEEYEHMREASMRFDRIAEALAADFITIYYINIETDRYIQYKAGKRQKNQSLSSFFHSGKEGLLADVCKEDRDMVKLDFRKKKVLRELDKQKTYSLIYRVNIDGSLRYVSMKAAKVEGDDSHIIIGIRNVDDEIKREEDYAHQLSSAHALAHTDSLTGVFNKLAYANKEEEINRAIHEGHRKAFAVLVCDVNGLKSINDSLGHKAGDEYIRSASALISSSFAGSPVYRIGGDEFTVILQGKNYHERKSLLQALDQVVEENLLNGRVVIATGLSDYCPQRDEDFAAVFERADSAMYARKRLLKTLHP